MYSFIQTNHLWLLLLLSHFSRVRLCATPKTAAHQASLSLGFSRQGHWSGLPFPSPMHESEKRKQSCSVMSNSSWPHEQQPTRLLHPWDSPGESTGVGCHCLLQKAFKAKQKYRLTRNFLFVCFMLIYRTQPYGTRHSSSVDSTHQKTS